MQYIASLSYGKDSCAMLEIIHQHHMPLDRIVHVEIMATDTIHADLPPMMAFKEKADDIIKARYGIVVEHIRSPHSYEDTFYRVRRQRGKKPIKHDGQIYGFPMVRGAWCNDRLKTGPLDKYKKSLGEHIDYIGIAADEPNRFHNLSDRKISPLVEHDITEQQAWKICEELGLLSPIYTQATRGGCWFCHNQSLWQLRLLRHQHPEHWRLMLKWDNDSPVVFRPNGTTVHDLEKRFFWEDQQITMDEHMQEIKAEGMDDERL